LQAPDTQQKPVTSDSITGILKRIIAENGREHLWGYVFAISCLVIVALSTAYTAWIMKSVINEAFEHRRADIVWVICFTIFIAFVLRGFASYGQAVVLSKIGNNIVARYQQRAYTHLMKLSLGYFNQTRSAHVVAQLNQNISGIRDVMNLTITSTVRDLLTFISLLAVMFIQDPLLSLAVFILAPPLLYALRYVSKRLRVATKDAINVNSHVAGAMQETIQGIAIVKAFTMERQLGQKVDRLVESAERRANRIARLSERTAPLTESFAGLAVASVLAYAAYGTIYKNIPPGAFFSFVTALLLAYDPARRLARLQVQMERAVVNARMIYEFLDIVPHQRDVPGAKALVVTEAKIEFRNVSFAYGDDEVLRDVSLIADGGKTTALVGPSGAGKSTIITLIPRFYDPKAGQILIGSGHCACDETVAAGATGLCLPATVSLRGYDPRQHPLWPPGGDR